MIFRNLKFLKNNIRIDRTQDPQYLTTAVLKNLSLKNRSTKKPQYSKTAVSKTAVLKNHSLKNRSTQNPQYSKNEVLKTRSTQKPQIKKYDNSKKNFTKNVDYWLKFPNHHWKSLYYHCISRGSLRKSMTMVYKFHKMRIVKLFSKPQ